MTECDDAVKGVKDDARVNHLVIVQLSKILDLSSASLVEPKVVLLKAKSDILENVVDDSDGKVLMVSVKSS